MAKTLPVSIAAGTSLSGPVLIGTLRVLGIQMPASVWTPAPLTFLASLDGRTFFDLFRDGNELVIPTQAGIFCSLPGADFSGVSQLQIRSGTSDTPIPQTVAASLLLRVQ